MVWIGEVHDTVQLARREEREGSPHAVRTVVFSAIEAKQIPAEKPEN